MRGTPDPPTRVFGKLLLDELRDVMTKTCAHVSEDDRQRVIDFMSQRLVVGSQGRWCDLCMMFVRAIHTRYTVCSDFVVIVD